MPRYRAMLKMDMVSIFMKIGHSDFCLWHMTAAVGFTN